jgi:hypothetical protein
VDAAGDVYVVDHGNHRVQKFEGNILTAQGPGNWHEASTWNRSRVPATTEDVVLGAGATVTLEGSAQCRSLDVRQGATLIIPSSGTSLAAEAAGTEGIALTADAMVSIKGTMRQTKPVDNADVAFLEIRNSAGTSTLYRGVGIHSFSDLGDVTVTIKGLSPGEYCTTTGAASPAYARRCFWIAATADLPAIVRLWAAGDELSSIAEGDLSVYHHVGGGIWTELLDSRATGTDGSGYFYAQGQTAGFSAFLLGEAGNGPTALTLQDLNARPGSHGALGLLALSGLALTGLALVALARLIARRNTAL